MAFKVIITKKFEKSAAKTSGWLEKEWSLKVPLNFDKRIEIVLDELAKIRILVEALQRKMLGH